MAGFAAASRGAERSLQGVEVARLGSGGQLGGIGLKRLALLLEFGLFLPDFSFGLAAFRACAKPGPANQATRAAVSDKSSPISVNPGCAANACADQPRRERPSTRQPCASNSSAIACPSPWLWPVRRAVLWVFFIGIL